MRRRRSRRLQDAGIKIAAEQEVIVLDMEDRPGALGEVARRLGKAKVNLTTALPGDQHPAGACGGQPRRSEGRAQLISVCSQPWTVPRSRVYAVSMSSW